MYFQTYLCIFFIIKLNEARKDTPPPISIPLRPEEIVQSFQSIVTSEYLQKIANEFAAKAAEHFMSEIKTKEAKLAEEYNHLRLNNEKKSKGSSEDLAKSQSMPDALASVKKINGEEGNLHLKFNQLHESLKAREGTTTSPQTEVKLDAATFSPLLNERQAFALLDAPSPDGDNLEVDYLTHTEEETNEPEVKVKINGVYYRGRRLLALV